MADRGGQRVSAPPPPSPQIKYRSVFYLTNEDGPSMYSNNLQFQVVYVMLDIPGVKLCSLIN